MTSLRIQCLGGLHIALDDEAVTGFHSRKARALLCYLAVTGTTHTRSALAGLLWGDLPETSARANLRKVLSNLGQLVGPHLAISRADVAMNHTEPWWLDVADFEAGLQSKSLATLHGIEPTDSAPVEIDPVERAIALYAGDFLFGFDLRDAPEFELWVLSQRARQHQLAVDGLGGLVRYYTDAQDQIAAINYAKQLIAMEPWREESHRRLMRLLAESGQRSAALKQYETCREILAMELDVEPSSETVALWEAIRHDDLSQAAEPTASNRHGAPWIVPAPGRQVIQRTSPLIGREADLTTLCNLLMKPSVRLVTVLGAGGIGKTHLAQSALDRLTRDIDATPFAHGVDFVPLAELSEPSDLIAAIAQALNFSFYTGGGPKEQLLGYLGPKQLLLVLDNYEQLLPDVAFIRDLLHLAPGIKLLVTSRLKLNLQNEHLYPLTGLDFPRPVPNNDILDSAALQASAAGQLFVRSAQRVHPAYLWKMEDWFAIRNICQLTSGTPLALILAATWMETLSPAEIARELDSRITSRLDFLASDLQDMPDRHRSMRAVFDSSWNRLPENEKTLSMTLSVFRGGFTRQAADAVSNASLRALSALVGKFFLQRTPDGRYVMHDLLHQYVKDRLTEAQPNHTALRDRHSAFFCAELQAREIDWKQGRQVAAFAAIAADHENFRAAWRWAAACGQAAWLIQAMDSLGEYYTWEARYEEGETIFNDAAERIALHRTEADQVTAFALLAEVRILVRQAEFNREYLVRKEKAVELLARAQALLEHPALLAHDVRRERASLLIQLARVARDRGDQASDLTFWRESLRLSEELDDFEWVTYKTAGLGWGALRSGNYEEAHRHFVRARDQWQEQGNTLYLSNSLAGLGSVALHRGDLAEGEMLLREGMAAFIRTHGRLDKLVNLHQLLAETLLYSGQFAEARAIIDEGIDLYSAAARVDAANNLRHTRALLLSHMGEYDEAYLQAKAVYLRRALHPGKAAATATVLGQITLAQKQYRASEEWLRKSLELYTQIGQQARQGLPLTLLAIVQQVTGNSAAAISSLQKARNLLVIERSVPPLLTFFPSAAWLFAQQGRAQLALECYALATRYQFVTESRWIADIMGAPLKATARLQAGTVVAEPTHIKRQPLWTEAEQLCLIE